MYKNFLAATVSIVIVLFSAYAMSYWIDNDGTLFYFMLCVLLALLSFGSILFATLAAIDYFTN